MKLLTLLLALVSMATSLAAMGDNANIGRLDHRENSIDICSGSFTGYYQGLSQPLTIQLTPVNQVNVNVSISFDGRVYGGTGTCVKNSAYSAIADLNITGAPRHSGSISVSNGEVVFSGTQTPGYAFVASHSIYNNGGRPGRDNRYNVCNGSFAGYYQGIPQPLTIQLTAVDQLNVTVSIYFQGKVWSGTGTCVKNSAYSAFADLSIGGAPRHSGSIYLSNGEVVFSGTQTPGYSFIVSRPAY